MSPIAYRNSCPGGFPGLVSRFAGTLLQRIIAFHVFIRRSHRPAAQGHAVINAHIGIVSDDYGAGSGQFLAGIGRTKDDIVLFIIQSVVITNHNVRLVLVDAVTGDAVVGADDVVILAVSQGILEAIDIVVLSRCAFSIRRIVTSNFVAHADDLSHVGFVNRVAAAHDHDLSTTLRNGILQGFLKSICIFTCNSSLNVRKRIRSSIKVTIRIRHAVACTDDDSCIGICCHVSLADDAVGYAAECLACTRIVIDVDSTYRNSCSALQTGTYNARVGTGNSRGNASCTRFVACGHACKSIVSSTIIIFIGTIVAKLKAVCNGIILGLSVADGSLHLPYRSSICISGTVFQSGDLIVADVHIAAADGGALSIQGDIGTTAICTISNRSNALQILGQLDGEAAGFGNTIVQRTIVFRRSRHHADVIAGQLGCISDTACNTQRMVGCRGIQPGIRRGIGRRAAGFHRIAGETDAVLQVGNVVVTR